MHIFASSLTLKFGYGLQDTFKQFLGRPKCLLWITPYSVPNSLDMLTDFNYIHAKGDFFYILKS